MKHKENKKSTPETGTPETAVPPAVPAAPAAGEVQSIPVPPGPVPPAEPFAGLEVLPDDRIRKLEEDNKALADRLLRLQADFDNFRKRAQRERNDLYTMANEDIFKALLPVLDNAYLALQSSQVHLGTDHPIVSGFRLVIDELFAVMGRFGLRLDEPRDGQFDPNRQEAISHLPSEKVPSNHVMELFRRGYFLKERLLRAAQVIVSSGKASDASAAAAENGQGVSTGPGGQAPLQKEQ